LRTVRPNRLQNCKLLADKELKKIGRGSHVEKVATADGIDISVVQWFDNRSVTLLSSFVGAEPMQNVQRWCKTSKSYTEVPRPHVVSIYNQHMVGADLLDFLIGLYRTRI